VQLIVLWTAAPSAMVAALHAWRPAAGMLAHAVLLYMLIALGDLFKHVRRVGRAAAAGDERGARDAIGMLVGRDTDRMDVAACRRAAIESLAENFVDGFLSALFWYAIGGHGGRGPAPPRRGRSGGAAR
jgi:adenosylcobinamide-phosphate synthase